MALGCAFILLVLVMLWRRHARRRRAKRTEMFASAKAIRRGWKERVTGFFGGRKRNNQGVILAGDDRDLIGLKKMREQEQERHYKEIEKLLDAYEVASSRAGAGRGHEEGDQLETGEGREDMERSRSGPNRYSQLSAESLYSQITGENRRMAEPRMPVKKQGVETSRFSMSTLGRDNSGKSSRSGQSIRRKTPPLLNLNEDEDSTITEAEKYARTHQRKDGLEDGLLPLPSTSGGKNPFRR
jgi:hypothetical protein